MSLPRVVVDPARYDEIRDWVAVRIPHCFADDHEKPGDCFGPGSVGFGVERDGRLIAAVVYHAYRPRYQTIECSFAADPGSRWATRETVGRLLLYPFVDAGCNVVLTIIPARNVSAIKLNLQLGFEPCGTIPKGYGFDDAAMLALTRENAARWTGVFKHG